MRSFAIESARTDPLEFIETAEHVVTPLIGRYTVREGDEVTARFTYLWTFSDGRLVRITLFQEVADALEAAGGAGM